MDRLERTRRNEDRRRRLFRKALIRLLAAGVGFGLGQLCNYLPEEFQMPCHIAAKLSAFLGGGG